jgi:hypothetical protein
MTSQLKSTAKTNIQGNKMDIQEALQKMVWNHRHLGITAIFLV